MSWTEDEYGCPDASWIREYTIRQITNELDDLKNI
jgi:hypothetical protein